MQAMMAQEAFYMCCEFVETFLTGTSRKIRRIVFKLLSKIRYPKLYRTDDTFPKNKWHDYYI